MTHTISFQKRCNYCKQSNFIKNEIKILDLDGKFNSSLSEERTIEQIKKSSKEMEYQCPNCGQVDNFIFYEIEIDGNPIGNHSKLIKKIHKNLIQNKHTLMFYISIEIVKISPDFENKGEKLVQLSDKQTGIFEINDSICKLIINTIDNSKPFGYEPTLGFGGQIEDIKYNQNGEIEEVTGLTSNWTGDTNFKITKGVTSINNHAIIERDNLYIDIQKTKYEYEANNFLLSNIKLLKP